MHTASFTEGYLQFDHLSMISLRLNQPPLVRTRRHDQLWSLVGFRPTDRHNLRFY